MNHPKSVAWYMLCFVVYKKYRSRVGLNHRPFGQQPSALPTELREQSNLFPPVLLSNQTFPPSTRSSITIIAIIIKMNLNILLLIFVIIYQVIQQDIFARPPISEKEIQNQWPQLAVYLNQLKVLRIYDLGITEDSMVRILRLNLSKIEELHFQPEIDQELPKYRYQFLAKPVLTHRIVRTIFQGDYFQRLRVLNLGGTNIDDRYLRFLEEDRYSSNIKVLSLANCLIGREGFQLLARLELPALTSLNVYGTLLKQADAVKALGDILCGIKNKGAVKVGKDKQGGQQAQQQQQQCGKEIAELNIGATNIEREPFVKLMERLKTAPLRVLRLASLDLLYKSTYREGFDYSAFAALTRFPNLEELNLKSCLLDDSVALTFASWILQKLRRLHLGDNHLSDKGVTAWLTAKNMPLLSHLSLSTNEVSDGTVAHFAAQKFNFTHLTLGKCKLTAKGIQLIANVNTKNIHSLSLAFNMPTTFFKSLIQAGKLTTLQHLTIAENNLFTSAFTLIDFSKLPKLKSLTFQNNSNLVQSFDQLFIGQPRTLSNSVEYLVVENGMITQTPAFFIIVGSSRMFPSIKEVVIRQKHHIFIPSVVLNKVRGNTGTFIDVNKQQFRKYFFDFDLVSMDQPEFVLVNSEQALNQYDAIQSRIPEISKSYLYSRMEKIIFAERFTLGFYSQIFDALQIKELPRLRELRILKPIYPQMLLDAFAGISLPNLRTFQVKLLITPDWSNREIQEQLLPFFENLKLISTLVLDIKFLNEESGHAQKKQFMDALYFPFLHSLTMTTQDLEVQQIAQFIRIHNQTLRQIDLGNNFMQKKFLNILVQADYRISQLNLNSTSFIIDEFAVLGKVRTQFMESLHLAMCDLTNEHVYAMLAQKQTLFFPKLVTLNLVGNDIRKEGLKALLETQLYNLAELMFKKNSNPSFINLLLDYPTRVQVIEASNVEVYGVNPDLAPYSARSIHTININTKSFIRSDFQSLAKLQFSRLETCYFQIHNIYDCQVLVDLLKISQYASYFSITISNDNQGLNSECLQGTPHKSRVTKLKIIDKHGTTYLPHFAVRLGNTIWGLRELSLNNTRLSYNIFSSLFKTQSSFSQLQVIQLGTNLITDEGMKYINSFDLGKLRVMDFSNAGLTEFSPMSSSGFYWLSVLNLNSNKLNKQSIIFIKDMKAVNIWRIYLSKCGLKGDSLAEITKFQMEGLLYLDLSFNDFTEMDVLGFAAHLQIKRFPRLIEINLSGIPLTKVASQSVKNILQAKHIKCKLDRPQNIQHSNSAQY